MKTGFHGPRSRANAALLLGAAAALGYPAQVIKTTRGGYSAPEDVIQAALGLTAIEEGVVYPAPSEPAPEPAEEKVRPNNGAGRPAWADYAESVGIEVTDEDTRNGLIAKVDALQEGTD